MTDPADDCDADVMPSVTIVTVTLGRNVEPSVIDVVKSNSSIALKLLVIFMNPGTVDKEVELPPTFINHATPIDRAAP